MRNLIIYISGKYSDRDFKAIEANIQKARLTSAKIWELGFTALCPHLNTYHFEQICKCTYEDYINGDLALLNNCHGIFMLNNWQESKGAKIEHEYAEDLKIKIFYSLDELQKHKEELQWNLTQSKIRESDKILSPERTETQISEREDMTSYPQEHLDD